MMEPAADPALARLAAALAGRYAIEREVGAGGMATVYVAEDVKHRRKVALKVLRADLSAIVGAERFLKEIEVTAKLQHPHLLPLFDSGSADGLLFYVMPFVEGESLRAKLDRERQLGVEEAVRIATQVAGALDHAHRHGVLHRDIKPENILMQEGQALIADFGIALALRQAGGSRLTETGLSLGTPQYMSPEQATGDRVLDARSDIYSLACVLYEMLAGEPPHTGPTVQAVIAKVVTETARPVDAARRSVPAHVAIALDIALEKTPADRFATAAEFAAALANEDPVAARRRPGVRDRARGGSRNGAPRRSWRAALPWAAVAVLLAIIGVLLAARRGSSGAPPVIRFTITPPAGDSTRMWWIPRPLAISRDGRRIAFMGIHASDTVTRIYLRDLGDHDTHAIAGTEGGTTPAFSPDGEWIAYFDWAAKRVMRVPVRGGQPQIVCECGGWGQGMDWGADGWITVDPGPYVAMHLLRVKATGGTPVPVRLSDSVLGQNEYWLNDPQLLPDGDHLLVTVSGSGGNGVVKVAAISLATGRRTNLLDNAWMARYVPPGYLVYAKPNELWAIRFDPKRVATVGEPVRVVDSVFALPNPYAEFALSATGTLVYATPTVQQNSSRLVWVDRSDRLDPIPAVHGGWWFAPKLSPNGRFAVFAGGGTVAATGGVVTSGVWLFDPAHSTVRRLTDAAADAFWPIVTPDGKRIVYNSNAYGGPAVNLYWAPLDGSTPPERLTKSALHQQAYSFLPDGSALAFQQGLDAKTGFDMYLLSLTGDHAVRPLLVTPASEREPDFSPDGRWLAYTSDESGRDEVYVRPYPAMGAPMKISVDGGEDPAWTRDGREILFVRTQWWRAAIYSAPFRDGPAGPPRRLIDLSQRPGRNYLDYGNTFGRSYDLTPDGRRILTFESEATIPIRREYRVEVGWLTELRARFEARP